MNQNNSNTLKRPWQFGDYNDITNSENPYVSLPPLNEIGWNEWSSNDFYQVGSQPPVETADQNENFSSQYLSTVNDNVEAGGSSPSVVSSISPVETPSEICFGAITGVHTRLKSQPQGLSNESSGQCFRVCSDGAYYGLSPRSSETLFSVFSKKTCEELRQLSEWKLRLEAYAHTKDIKTSNISRQQEKSSSIVVDINIYGAREDANQVGKRLSSFGITLQQPLIRPTNAIYYNPHFLHVQEIFGHNVAETPFLSLGAETSTTSSGERSLVETKSQVDVETEVDSILNSLSHHTMLHKQATIKGLKTPLKDFQLEAIDFMLRREKDTLPPELALWKEVELDTGDVIYQHIISGTRRQKPEESNGGILADEMGLGKTMVALSIIASSMDRAIEFASESLQSSDKQNNQLPSRATLVIVPSSLLIDGWVDEIRKHIFPGYISHHKYHGPRREEDTDKLFSSDIVLTTYATVATEITNGRNVLSSVRWFRIILDEAHEIRNRITKQFQVAVNLMAQYRWCLTGTPIQNSLDDLGALVTFVKVPLLENSTTFRRFIVNQSKSETRERFKNLRTLLGSICLRRTKDIVRLADPIEKIYPLDFTPSEREEYEDMLSKCRTRIDRCISGDSKGLNSAMLKSLLQLCLFCNLLQVTKAKYAALI